MSATEVHNASRDAAVGKVAHPAGHSVLEGQPAVGVTEVHALDLTGDQHPIADHRSTLTGGPARFPGADHSTGRDA